MARGIQRPVVRYILKMDEGLPTEEQTIFHINQLSYLESVPSTKRNIRAYSSDVKGRGDIDPDRFKRAKKEDFVEAVNKVENYLFGYHFPDLQEEGWIKEFEDRDTIMKLLEDLPGDAVREILDVANGGSVEGTILEDVHTEK